MRIGKLIIKNTAIISLVVLITFTAYSETLYNALLNWDDQIYLIHNPHIKALSWENFQGMFTSYKSNWTPLTWLSHALVYAGFKFDPWGHHLANVILHCLNTVLVFILAIVLISLYQTSKKFKFTSFAHLNNKTLLAAGITALLFGIHPQHVEAVAWISARKDVLSLFFILSTLLFYLLYVSAQITKTRFSWYLSALFCFVLALLSKPVAITLPAVLILMDIYPLKRTSLIQADATKNPDNYRVLFVEKIPFLLLSAILVILTIMAHHQGGGLSGPESIDIIDRFFNATNSIILYLSKWVLPISFLPFYPLSKEVNFMPMIACFLITFVCVYGWYKKKYYWLVIWLFYLITLLPVLGFIPFGKHAAADRFAYLPTLPFYLLVGLGFANLYYTYKGKIYIITSMLLFFLGLSIALFNLTKQQTFVWKDDLTLWSYTVLYSPNNVMARAYLGGSYWDKGVQTYFIDDYWDKGYFENAYVHSRTAFLESLNNKNNQIYYKVVSRTYYELGFKLMKSGHLQVALSIFEDLIKNSLNGVESHNNLSVYYHQIGQIYYKQGLLPKSRSSLENALAINPEHQPSKQLLSIVTSKMRTE